METTLEQNKELFSVKTRVWWGQGRGFKQGRVVKQNKLSFKCISDDGHPITVETKTLFIHGYGANCVYRIDSEDPLYIRNKRFYQTLITGDSVSQLAIKAVLANDLEMLSELEKILSTKYK